MVKSTKISNAREQMKAILRKIKSFQQFLFATAHFFDTESIHRPKSENEYCDFEIKKRSALADPFILLFNI
ncbi:hypothetical protein CLV90_2768 [Maribacter spongiicola]|uniref:Uncharacterized protein n=1 Tax=Maribacter spongiicola TaxID=1206753 RepID=A0A4R7JZS5_9FLAO|nr:hypothetical protein CLV90_2768 [Maribacter spongiicola]